MDELEQARARKETLYQRYQEANAAALNAAGPRERVRQRERARMLREMYREACEEVRRLDPERPRIKGKKPPGRMDSAMASGTVWADLEGLTWSQAEGRSWDELPETGRQRQRKLIRELVQRAMGTCTAMQRAYMNAYYAEELTMEEIGERFGVNKATVSHTLERGRRRVERYVTAKLLLSKCVDRNGLFDYQLFINSAQVLTERQKEMVYLALAQDTSYREIAGYVERAPSTVFRTVKRARKNLERLSVELDAGLSSVRVKRADWAGRSEKELAEDLGLSPAFYYRIVRREEHVGGIPLLHCVILDRLAAGENPEAVSAALGCSRPFVERVRRAWQGTPPPAFAEDYRPKAPKRTKPPDNPFVSVGDGTAIIDRIDASTYQALRERFGGVS